MTGGSLGAARLNETMAARSRDITDAGIQVFHAAGNGKGFVPDVSPSGAPYIVREYVDRMDLRPRRFDAMDYSWPMALVIGLFQVLAMIPGVSRSGATIVGAMLLGADKRSAAEFSFFLAMPTMAGAFAYDLYKNRDILSAADLPVIATGFIAAFVVAVFVVRYLLDYVSRHGYALFGWWRLIVGAVGLAALYIWG